MKVARVILLQLSSVVCVLGVPLIGTVLEDVNTAVVVRDKRDPSRSMTFSGFMPGSGLSAFASSGEFTPYHGYGGRRRPWGHEEYPAQPPAVEHPPERGAEKPWHQPEEKDKEGEDEEEEEEAPATRPSKKNKKKYTPKDTQEEDEEEYEKPSRGGGNARASFNAWFPIMLGMFPSSGGYPSQGEDGGYSRGYPQNHGSGQGPRYPQGGAPHTTVIANSVSHGRSGVASSHAIAYGGGSPPHNPSQGR